MKGIPGTAVVLSLLLLPLFSFSHLAAQDQRPPEVQAMDVWIGGWDYDLDGDPGYWEWKWFGNSLLTAKERTPAGRDVVHFMAWDPQKEAYVWNRYWSSGYVDQGVGWLQDDTWTFLFLGTPGAIQRLNMAFESEDVLGFKWERSVKGGSWEVIGEGRTVRKR